MQTRRTSVRTRGASWAAAVGVAMFTLSLSAAAATAQPRWSDKTKLTFDGPIMVPGRTLPAGSYWFQLADSPANRQIVQIWNEDQTDLIATTIAVPTRRTEVSDDIVVRFNTTQSGTPALKAWFYPGQRTGHLFVYSEDQARRIAQASKTLVLSGDADPAHTDASGEMFEIDERGTRRQYTSNVPPNVRAGAADADAAQRTLPSNRTGAQPSASGTPVRSGSQAQSRSPSRSADADAREHLDELDRLLIVLLGPNPPMSQSGAATRPADSSNAQPVGTSGTTMTANAAGTITIDRARLDELRTHLAQARAALDRLAREHRQK